MKSVQLIQAAEVIPKFQSYPAHARSRLEYLRQLIIDTASEIDGIETLEETLKWGEPSYLCKTGSTIRIDWKPNAPDQVAMYFKCTSKLVPTFKQLFGNLFEYENSRAILFDLQASIPEKELKKCIELALKYHLVKNTPLLGEPA
ncbi:MAG: DUF1801 domain-containing protein [Lewinellaceae bacterium]|nr:DUF1801 domain-containing protein [Saprospiraceae bacterium]MCB9343344.1 DUF1801 domain-containing protein [Lewinellaceae bacterium]